MPAWTSAVFPEFPYSLLISSLKENKKSKIQRKTLNYLEKSLNVCSMFGIAELNELTWHGRNMQGLKCTADVAAISDVFVYFGRSSGE